MRGYKILEEACAISAEQCSSAALCEPHPKDKNKCLVRDFDKMQGTDNEKIDKLCGEIKSQGICNVVAPLCKVQNPPP